MPHRCLWKLVSSSLGQTSTPGASTIPRHTHHTFTPNHGIPNVPLPTTSPRVLLSAFAPIAPQLKTMASLPQIDISPPQIDVSPPQFDIEVLNETIILNGPEIIRLYLLTITRNSVIIPKVVPRWFPAYMVPNRAHAVWIVKTSTTTMAYKYKALLQWFNVLPTFECVD